jgi:hypothetical protein
MKGIEAILYYDGFAMAGLGITVVFASLVVLALIISRLHNLLFIWENRRLYIKKILKRFSQIRLFRHTPSWHNDESLIGEARQIHLLVQTMGEPFSLPVLIRKAQTSGIDHVHFKVSRLIENNFIVPDKKGFFLLNHELFDKVLKISGK